MLLRKVILYAIKAKILLNGGKNDYDVLWMRLFFMASRRAWIDRGGRLEETEPAFSATPDTALSTDAAAAAVDVLAFATSVGVGSAF